MTRRRRTHTSEFKTDAVKLITEKGYSFKEASDSLDVSQSLLRSWKDAFQDKGDSAFPGNGRPSVHDEELRRLRAENKRLLVERDILKKAAAFFAREAT